MTIYDSYPGPQQFNFSFILKCFNWVGGYESRRFSFQNLGPGGQKDKRKKKNQDHEKMVSV